VAHLDDGFGKTHVLPLQPEALGDTKTGASG